MQTREQILPSQLPSIGGLVWLPNSPPCALFPFLVRSQTVFLGCTSKQHQVIFYHTLLSLSCLALSWLYCIFLLTCIVLFPLTCACSPTSMVLVLPPACCFPPVPFLTYVTFLHSTSFLSDPEPQPSAPISIHAAAQRLYRRGRFVFCDDCA